MRRSRAEVYLHLVWTTQNRQPWLTPELAPSVYDCIETVVRRLSCTVLAIGGMPDHVHLVVMLAPKTAITLLAQQVKGTSSKLVTDLSKPNSVFRWQEGYGVFSLSRPDLPKVIAYAENQERHHERGNLWAALEETDEEVAELKFTR